MKILFNKKQLSKLIHYERNLGFVPTMGFLHSGHVSLIKKSMIQCRKTIVSIYINKQQFNKKSDYLKYPKNIKKDISLLKKLKIDYLYMPKSKEIYYDGANKNIKIDSLSKKLCGKYRPNHFNAVADVIDRFLKIIKPSKIYFGEKDMQQLLLIKNFIKKKYKNVKVISCKTIREKNGIALSSRNFFLKKREKYVASNIYKLIFRKKKLLINKVFSIKKLEKKIMNMGVKKIDYLELLNINKLIKPYKRNKRYRIFIAYYLGSTRLIDNI